MVLQLLCNYAIFVPIRHVFFQFYSLGWHWHHTKHGPLTILLSEAFVCFISLSMVSYDWWIACFEFSFFWLRDAHNFLAITEINIWWFQADACSMATIKRLPLAWVSSHREAFESFLAPWLTGLVMYTVGCLVVVVPNQVVAY